MSATEWSSLPGSQNITRVTLANGIVVLVYEKFDAQSVVIAGSLRAGSIYESRCAERAGGADGVGADARRAAARLRRHQRGAGKHRRGR